MGSEDIAISDEDTEQLERQLPAQHPRTAPTDDDISDSASSIDSDASDTCGDPMELDGEYFWTHFISESPDMVTHQSPTLNFVNRGMLRRDAQAGKGYFGVVGEKYFQYSYPVGDRKFGGLADHDIFDSFGPSRFPPRVAYCVEPARAALAGGSMAF